MSKKFLVLSVFLSLSGSSAFAASCEWSASQTDRVTTGKIENVEFGKEVKVDVPGGIVGSPKITLESVRTGIDSTHEFINVDGAKDGPICDQKIVESKRKLYDGTVAFVYSGLESTCGNFQVRCYF